FFFFSSRRRHTRFKCDWSSDVCSSDLSPKVAVINETMARLYFPGGSPIGRRFGIESDPAHAADFEVIGVVKDAKYESLDERPQQIGRASCRERVKSAAGTVT